MGRLAFIKSQTTLWTGPSPLFYFLSKNGCPAQKKQEAAKMEDDDVYDPLVEEEEDEDSDDLFGL